MSKPFAPNRLVCCTLLAVLGLATAAAPPAAADEEVRAVLITLEKPGKLAVIPVEPDKLAALSARGGLLIWAHPEQPERWRFVAAGWSIPTAAPGAAAAPAAAAAPTRGQGDGSSGAADSGLFLVQLDQLSPSLTARDIPNFLTPANGTTLLNTRPALRRLPREEGPKYPEGVAVISSKNLAKELRVPFKAGESEVAFADFPGLASELADGLPPGAYTLRLEGGDPGLATFFIEDEAKRRQVLRPLDELAGLTGGRTGTLYAQFALDHLLAQKQDGLPLYLSDAFDLLNGLPERSLTPHLKTQRQMLLRWLRTEPKDRGGALFAGEAPGDATGIEPLDNARRLIAAAKWREALKALDDADFKQLQVKDKRARGLANLYRGVIFAEAGQGQEEQARTAFEEAIADLEGGAPADLFRAHNNFANFLQHQAQDRLSNPALQMAAGVSQIFLGAAADWEAARQHYEIALGLADKLGAGGQRAAVEVNLAGLYALLADLVRTLDAPQEGRRQFLAGEQAAIKQAETLAGRLVEAKPEAKVEPLVRSMAEEMLAHLAYRAGDFAACRTHAERARDGYLEAGHLAGVENVERVLGLTYLRPTGSDAAVRAEARQTALKHLKTALLISEALRERFPPDRTGRTRAGFFARKAFVSEKIVELLLEDSKDAEALGYAELAKARALQDLLAVGGTSTAARGERGLADLLAHWPTEAAALEYFLGAETAWVFVVAPTGKVKAYRLTAGEGQPITPRELVTRVQRILHNTENQAERMANRLLAGRGLDHSWQDDLYELKNTLLPADALTELRRAKVAVVVPQHVLHYFPFAALVTEPDRKAGPKDMVKPHFLIDEPFDLVYAPSLTAWGLLHQKAAGVIRRVNAVGLVQAPGSPELPGVAEDLKNLSTVFAGKLGTVYDGDKALEANAKKMLAQPGLLFFGTHGWNDADHPLDSHLILLPDPDREAAKTEVLTGDSQDVNDGRLTAREIFARRVGADLTVMSCCYSGLGDRSPLPGDDLFGLQRAFLQAGSRTVVSGLWDVYDGTAPDLMRGFFERLAAGTPTASALAASQRAFLEKYRASDKVEPYVHPYFWAVYTCAGDERTRCVR
ncbi:MAG TPA: CHAT domain-containing protein [Gemmataceae bacterium]|nr:CHAT domain-containing protein [Gemmataceae bacterium]